MAWVGRLAADAVVKHGGSRLIIAGGDTAAATLHHLRVASLTIVGQVEESVPILLVHGGPADGAVVVTKSGGFGKEDSLYNAYQTLLYW